MDRLDPYLVRDCTIAALNKDMDIARIQAFAQKNGRSEAEEKNTGIRKRIFQEGQIYRVVHGIPRRVQTTVFCLTT